MDKIDLDIRHVLIQAEAMASTFVPQIFFFDLHLVPSGNVGLASISGNLPRHTKATRRPSQTLAPGPAL